PAPAYHGPLFAEAAPPVKARSDGRPGPIARRGRFARGGPAAVIRRPTDGHRRAAAGIPLPAPPGERERAVLRPPRAARGPHAGGGGAARRDAGEAGRSR